MSETHIQLLAFDVAKGVGCADLVLQIYDFIRFQGYEGDLTSCLHGPMSTLVLIKETLKNK